MHSDDREIIFQAINAAKMAYEKVFNDNGFDYPPLVLTVKPLIYHDDGNCYGQIVDEIIRVEDYIKPLTRKGIGK